MNAGPLLPFDEALLEVILAELRDARADGRTVRDAASNVRDALLAKIGRPELEALLPGLRPAQPADAELILIPRAVLQRAAGVLNTAATGHILPARTAADVAHGLRVALDP